MGLLSFLKRSNDPAAEAPAPAAPDAVATARARARRRLIGAAVLLGVGVVGFPLLFETQPRPIPVNIPIEIPRKDGAPALAPPAMRPPLAPASAAVVLPDGEAEAPVAKAPAEIVERATDAGRELKPAASAAPTRAAAAAPATTTASSKAELSKPELAATKPPTPAAKASAARAADDSARVQALLNGQPASAPAARVVVQVGAYTEPAKLQEARQKLEKLGYKTYTQVVEVEGGKRTRVRIGPFANKAEADQAAARIKASGLPVAILTL